MKDFGWYKQSFANKHREIKDLLKQFARIEESEKMGVRPSADLEDGTASPHQQQQMHSAMHRFNQLSDEI